MIKQNPLQMASMAANAAFCRGTAVIMDAFIGADMNYIEELNASLS